MKRKRALHSWSQRDLESFAQLVWRRQHCTAGVRVEESFTQLLWGEKSPALHSRSMRETICGWSRMFPVGGWKSRREPIWKLRLRLAKALCWQAGGPSFESFYCSYFYSNVVEGGPCTVWWLHGDRHSKLNHTDAHLKTESFWLCVAIDTDPLAWTSWDFHYPHVVSVENTPRARNGSKERTGRQRSVAACCFATADPDSIVKLAITAASLPLRMTGKKWEGKWRF